ncbi:SET domain-containing protein-lysine N-methyltransferase, partial [archaeon]
PYSSAAHGSANRAAEETVRATASKAEIAIRVAGANALACNWNDALSQEERHISVIAMATAMCNHACAPTARYTSYWDAKRACPVIRLYALSDIPAGGEVTISYTDVSASKADRQAALARYGFVCACSRCAPTWDDTMVLKCAACETGRLYVGAPACADCGADAGDSAQPGGALAKQREEYLSGHRFLPQIALYDSRTNSVVHLCDATRLNAAYQQLHTAWGLEADVAAEVYRALMPAFEKARVQWNAQMPQLRVLAGHVYTAAGLREDAAREYTAAVAEYRAAYGSEAAITQMVQALVDRPPRNRADVEAFEQKRVSTASWVTACGLPRKTAQRWLQPITVSAAASIMGHGAGASGSTKAEQVVVNELIRCTQIAKSLGLAPAPTSAPAVEAAAGAGTAAEVAA